MRENPHRQEPHAFYERLQPAAQTAVPFLQCQASRRTMFLRLSLRFAVKNSRHIPAALRARQSRIQSSDRAAAIPGLLRPQPASCPGQRPAAVLPDSLSKSSPVAGVRSALQPDFHAILAAGAIAPEAETRARIGRHTVHGSCRGSCCPCVRSGPCRSEGVEAAGLRIAPIAICLQTCLQKRLQILLAAA